MLPSITKDSVVGDSAYKAPRNFPIGPFKRYAHNPILRPNPNNDFESAYLYNATAIVVDDTVYLLYRAQNAQKTSTVGLAFSNDGYNFTRYNKPILYPTEPWENGGGCEDPRIVHDPVSKQFILTYTAYDMSHARLCVATSENLFDWKKHPPIISNDGDWNDIAILSNGDPIIRNAWLKSGAVFVDRHKDGRYYMIWGDCAMHLAESDDLVHWRLTSNDLHANTFATGRFVWEDRLIEPGAAPIKLAGKNSHYVLFYNASTTGGGDLATDTYALGQMLVDYDHIRDGPVARLERPFLFPELQNERYGQVDKVVFTEGIVQFHGKWFLYFGQGDLELGVATADAV